MLPVTDALSGSSPISDNAVTDLPQPDSPTSPSVSLRFRAKLTPRTACAGPRLVLRRARGVWWGPRLCFRPATTGRGGRSLSPLPPGRGGGGEDRAARRGEVGGG